MIWLAIMGLVWLILAVLVALGVAAAIRLADERSCSIDLDGNRQHLVPDQGEVPTAIVPTPRPARH
jgi:hypothetical protein